MKPAGHRPAGEALPNTEFFRRLARRMRLDEPYLQDSDEAILSAALTGGHPYLEGIRRERLQKDGRGPSAMVIRFGSTTTGAA